MDQTDYTDQLDQARQLEQPDEPPDEKFLLNTPFLCLYAFLVGGPQATLGVLSFIPGLRQNDRLLGFLHVTTADAIVYLVMGVIGLGIWYLGRRIPAIGYAISMLVVYLITFTAGEIAYDNAGAMPIRNFPWFLDNAFNLTLMVSGLGILVIASLQRGARRTEQYQDWQRFWMRTDRIRAIEEANRASQRTTTAA